MCTKMPALTAAIEQDTRLSPGQQARIRGFAMLMGGEQWGQALLEDIQQRRSQKLIEDTPPSPEDEIERRAW